MIDASQSTAPAGAPRPDEPAAISLGVYGPVRLRVDGACSTGFHATGANTTGGTT